MLLFEFWMGTILANFNMCDSMLLLREVLTLFEFWMGTILANFNMCDSMLLLREVLTCS